MAQQEGRRSSRSQYPMGGNTQTTLTMTSGNSSSLGNSIRTPARLFHLQSFPFPFEFLAFNPETNSMASLQSISSDPDSTNPDLFESSFNHYFCTNTPPFFYCVNIPFETSELPLYIQDALSSYLTPTTQLHMHVQTTRLFDSQHDLHFV